MVDPAERPEPSTSSSALYVPLPKPPAAFSLTVRKLLGRVQEGAIRVPSFQRPLRWTSSDVVKLFDSVLKGYPIGSLLFWKRKFEREPQVRVGSAILDAPAVDDGWSIVDGQQRITALAASLLELDQRGDVTWDLCFDPVNNVFLHGPVSPAEARRHVPLRALGDLRRLGRFLRDCDLSEEEQSRVEEVQQRLLDYEVPGYLLETDDVDAVRAVFARLNSTGVRMRADEVFQALLGASDARGVRRRRFDLGELQRAADIDGFGEPPRNEVMKAVLAMSGLDPSKRFDDFQEDALGKLVAPEDAAEALRQTVAFLQAPVHASEPGAEIPAYAFIPYPVVFVILAQWFYLFPGSSEPTRRALAQWLWRGVATGVHERAAVSAMRRQVRSIRAAEETESLQRLLDAAGEPPSLEWSLDPFHANHAASRVEILALLSLGPRDPNGPVSWRALLASGARVAREIFRVDAVDPPLRMLARTAANRVLLDTSHSHLRTQLHRWSWHEHRDALESHLIDEAGLEELQRNDMQTFLERRGARVRALVSRFVAQRASLGAPRILPVESYFDRHGETSAP